MSEEQKTEKSKYAESPKGAKQDAEGQWRTLNGWFCANCGFRKQSYETHAVFCPNCGARMRPVPYFG